MGFFDDLKKGLSGEIDDLLKFDGDDLPENKMEDKDRKPDIGRTALIEDPYFDKMGNVGSKMFAKQKNTRISNRTLKETSLRDWLVSSIIQHRVDTLLLLSRPQRKQFEMGFKVIKRDQVGNLTEEEKATIDKLEDFIYHCGRKNGVDQTDKMLFGEFLKLTARDALTFGYIAIEKIATAGGALHRFRPVPSESMYLIDQTVDKKYLEEQKKRSIKQKIENLKYQDNNPLKDMTYNQIDDKYDKYVQMSMDDQVLATFGDNSLIWKNFNPQNFMDSKGYCLSPLELAIINITNHMNIESYNSNFFTHGYAAKGILHLKGAVTQSQLSNFRRQFHNSITATKNAWRTPIVAGIDEINWLPMSGSAKEMEYLTYNQHVMRALCSQFQIDPAELGLEGALQTNSSSSSAGSESNESKLAHSKERGLKPLLMYFEDFVNNDIIPLIDPQYAVDYEFKFVGVDDETPQTKIALQQAEMTVHASLNDLLSEAGKTVYEDIAANLPLNAQFWELVEKNYTRGEIREKFFGEKGAKDRPELQYIPSDPGFANWQQMLFQIAAQKQQQKEIAKQEKAQQDQMQQQEQMMQQQQEAQQQQMQQQEQMQQQAQQQELQHKQSLDINKDKREQEKHEAEMKQLRDQRLSGVLNKNDGEDL